MRKAEGRIAFMGGNPTLDVWREYPLELFERAVRT